MNHGVWKWVVVFSVLVMLLAKLGEVERLVKSTGDAVVNARVDAGVHAALAKQPACPELKSLKEYAAMVAPTCPSVGGWVFATVVALLGMVVLMLYDLYPCILGGLYDLLPCHPALRNTCRGETKQPATWSYIFPGKVGETRRSETFTLVAGARTIKYHMVTLGETWDISGVDAMFDLPAAVKQIAETHIRENLPNAGSNYSFSLCRYAFKIVIEE